MEIIEGFKTCIYYVIMAIVWILGIMMAYAALILIIAPFWKGEVGKEARKSCIAYILVIIVPIFIILTGNLIYNRYSNKETKEKTDYKQVKNALYSTELSENYVYICTGKNSTRYHKYIDCIGLSKCSEDIEELPIDEAVEQGYEPCKRCYE